MSCGEQPTSGEDFPEIKAMRIEVTSTQLPFGAVKALQVFTMENHPGEYIACSAHLCCAGGFHIGEILDDMVQRRATTHSAVVACKGYRGSPKGCRRYGPCPNRVSVNISLTLKG